MFPITNVFLRTKQAARFLPDCLFCHIYENEPAKFSNKCSIIWSDCIDFAENHWYDKIIHSIYHYLGKALQAVCRAERQRTQQRMNEFVMKKEDSVWKR
jgi:hypothetical protein